MKLVVQKPRLTRLFPVLPLLLWAALCVAAPERIDVRITTHLGDQQSFVEGDRLSFFLSLDRDAYIHLFYLDADANLFQLLPSPRLPDHFYRKGLFLPLPPEAHAHQFTIRAPFGDEYVFVYASDRPEFELDRELLDNGLIRIRTSVEALGATLRRDSTVAFGSSELLLKTLARSGAE